MFTCPYLTGAQESASSDESVVHDTKISESLGLSRKHDNFPPVDSNFDFSSSSLEAIASVTVTHDAMNTNDLNSAKNIKQNKSFKSAKQESVPSNISCASKSTYGVNSTHVKQHEQLVD